MARDLTPKFAVSFEAADGHVTQQHHHTQESNDAYASALPLMGIPEEKITKSYYDLLTRKWWPYTGRIFQTGKM